MSDIGVTEKSSISVRVPDLNNIEKSVNGVSISETEVALSVSDHGTADLATASFNSLTVGTTATNLAKLTTNKVDVRCKRGIQFKAASGNSGTIVIGGSSVAYNGTAANINGMPLAAGDTIFLEVTRLSAIFADASASSQVLHWIAY